MITNVKGGVSLLLTVFLTLGLSISAQSLLASWSNPIGNPPISNVSAPINVGNFGQSKNAGLVLNSASSSSNGLVVMHGNIGVGTIEPGAKLGVAGGAKFLDRVGIGDGVNTPYVNSGSAGIWYSKNGAPTAFAGLTGLGTGPTDDSWGININGWKFVVSPNGNIGIGTSAPIYSLDVNGTAHFTGDVCTDAGGGKCLSAINTTAAPAIVKGASYGYCTYTSSQTCNGCGKDYMYSCCNATTYSCDSASLLSPSICTGIGQCGCAAGYTLKLTGQNSWSTSIVWWSSTAYTTYYYTCVKD